MNKCKINSAKSSLLIVSKEQFGYLTDVYKWCEYLNGMYAITVLTFNDGKPKFVMDGIRTVYVPDAGLRTIRGLLFMLYSFFLIMFAKGKIIVCFFKECLIFKKFMPWKHLILDIRTMDVSPDVSERLSSDEKLKKCCNAYDFVTFISEGVRNKLSISEHKSAVVPLGSDVFSSKYKSFDFPRLLYVGTLFNRHIEHTIEGLAKALSKYKFKVHYDIVGDGRNGEMEMLGRIISELSLEEYVTLHGYVRHDKLAPFFENANVGVSYVPMTDYYDSQPPTKTFEYILSGLFTIATATTANCDVISEENGLLINDDSESFALALIEVNARIHSLNDRNIRETLTEYTWSNIVEKKLKPVLEK